MAGGRVRRVLMRVLAMAGAVMGFCAIEAPLAAAEDVVVARTGDLTSRQVDVGTGQLRISSATVRQDRANDRAQATVTLDAVPDGSSGATLVVAFGPVEGNVCQLNDFLDANQYSTPIDGSPAPGWTRNGATFRLDIADDAAGYQPWECAGAIIGTGEGVVSLLGGGLKDVFLRPKLRVGKPKILDRTVKGPLKLVRGDRHVIRIPLESLNKADAKGVVLDASGKGLRGARVNVGTVYGAWTNSVRLAVGARGRRVGPLRIKVTMANGATVRRKFAVRLGRRPARPRPGRYRSEDGDVTFEITGGRIPKVKGFRIYTRTRCGGYGDFPTYTNNYYSFPTARLDGVGVLDGSDRNKLYTVSLGLKAVGRKVSEGSFYYSVSEAPCSASDSFTASRVGP